MLKFLERKIEMFKPRRQIFHNKSSSYVLVTSKEEWKRIWLKLEKDIKEYEVVSLDTESRKGEEKEFCCRHGRNGELIEYSKKLKFVVLGAPNLTVVLDMHELKQEFPEELLDLIEDKDIAKIGSGIEKDMRQDFKGFQYRNLLDTQYGIIRLVEQGLFPQDEEERKKQRYGFGSISFSVYGFSYKPYMSKEKYLKRYNVKDDGKTWPNIRRPNKLYQWPSYFQPEINAYLDSDAKMPFVLIYRSAMELVKRNMETLFTETELIKKILNEFVPTDFEDEVDFHIDEQEVADLLATEESQQENEETSPVMSSLYTANSRAAGINVDSQSLGNCSLGQEINLSNSAYVFQDKIKIVCSICNFNGHSQEVCHSKTLAEWKAQYEHSFDRTPYDFFPVPQLVPASHSKPIMIGLKQSLRRYHQRYSVPCYLYRIHKVVSNHASKNPSEEWAKIITTIEEQIEYVVDRSRCEYEADKKRLMNYARQGHRAMNIYKKNSVKDSVKALKNYNQAIQNSESDFVGARIARTAGGVRRRGWNNQVLVPQKVKRRRQIYKAKKRLRTQLN